MPNRFSWTTFARKSMAGARRCGIWRIACLPCNTYKGPNIAGYDPLTKSLQRLFHPRRDQWSDHFVWKGPILAGKTPIGRTTIFVLAMNADDRVEHRRLLIEAGLFPPTLPRAN